MSIKRFPLNGYVIAVLATGVILSTLLSLQPLFGSYVPIIPFLLGIILAAWRGGLGAGLVATALSTLASVYFCTEPFYTIALPPTLDQVRVGALLAGGVLCSLVISQLLKAERLAWQEVIQHQEQRLKEAAERQKAEEALRERTELLERILATTDNPIFVKDTAGRYLMCNEALLRLLNAKAEDTLGRTDFEIFPRAMAQQLQEVDESLLAKGGTERVELTVRLPCGEQRLYLTHKTVYQDATGRPAEIVGVATDITERQRIEALLREQVALEEQLAKIAAHAPGVMYTYRVRPDGSACIPYAAPGIVDLYGVSPEELAEDASIILPLLHSDDVQRVITSIAESARTLSPWRNEYRVRHPLKGEIWIEGRATPQADADGGITWYGFLHEVTERKHSQERLALVSFALNRVKEAAFLIDEEARFCYVNDESCRVLGYRRDELLHLGIPDIAPDWSIDRWKKHWRALKAWGSLTFEADQQAKDGHLIPVEINANYFEYEGRGYDLGLVRDITERKATEHQLRLLTYALDKVSENIFLMGENDPHFLYVNQSAALTLGYSREELTGGMGVFDIDPRWSPEVWTGYWLELCVHRTLTFESEQRTKDGRLFPVEITGNYFEFDGQVYNLAIVRDISERKRIEAALRESEALYRSVVTAMAEGVVFQDANGAITTVNPAAERIMGRSAEQILGKTSEDLGWQAIHEDGRPFPGELRPARVTLRTGEPQTNVVMGIHKPEGTLTWLSINSQPLIAIGESKPYAVVTTFHDISERKRAEEMLREADRRKNEFLAMLGHELRNPLAPIRNAVQIMHKLDGNHPKLPWARDMIDRQVNHLTRLVDELLDVSRIVQGKLTLKSAPMAITPLIEHAVEAIRPLIEARHQTLMVAIPPDSLRVEGDDVRLTQVISNLLDNAAKYTPEGGRIWLTVTREQHEVVIDVRDTGEGIAASLLPHLFDLFTQAERTLDRAQGGLGLGLTIVRSIVELHGGWVEARSEGLGKGSEFIVRLPVLDREPVQSLAATQ